MLQTIREHSHGWIMGVILFLICIPFALWGISSYIGVGSRVVVAEVNGQELGLGQFQRTYQDFRLRMQATFGERFNPNLISDELIKNQALEQLVTNEILLQRAIKAGLRISEAQVASAIRTFGAFQVSGVFSNDLYESVLSTRGMTPSGFESQLHADMVTDQLRQGVGETAFVTDAERRRVSRLAGQRRDFHFTTIDAEQFRAEVEISEAQVAQHYNENQDLFMDPERVKIAYVELSIKGLMQDVSVSDIELREYYDDNVSNYGVTEERSANHILVRVEADATDEVVETARQKAVGYRDRAVQGESFEEIARQFSEDEGSKANGGETGYFRKGVMAPQFDEQVYAMAVGEISEPVRTDFGFHIVKLRDIRPGGTKSFEEAQELVEKELRREYAERELSDLTEQLAVLTYEQPDTLDVASEEMGLTVTETDWISRSGGTGIFADTRLIAAAFSEDVLQDSLNSDVIELDDDRLIVLRALDYRDQSLRPLNEVTEAITEELLLAEIKTRAAELGQSLEEQLDDGETRDAVAAAHALEWHVGEDVERRDPDINRTVLREAFRLSRPRPDSPSHGGVSLGNGGYTVIALTGVRDADPYADDEEVKAEISQRMQSGLSNQIWRDFVASLEAGARVTKYPGNL